MSRVIRDCSTYENCLTENRTVEINIESDYFQVAAVGCWGVYCNDGIYIKDKKGERTEVKRGQGLVSKLLKYVHEYSVEIPEFPETPLYDMFLAGDNVYDLLKKLDADEKEEVKTGYDMERQLRDGFENCFARSGIQRFFIGIGNHDIEDCTVLNKQFNYDNPLWNFPALYYNVFYSLKSYKINFIVMDTNMFDDEAKDCSGVDFTIEQKETQKNWIREQIANVGAKYNVIVGHIPYHANGHKKKKHPVYRQELAEFIRNVNPDLYICADEHNQQVIKDLHPKSKTMIIVCGSGGTDLDPFVKREDGKGYDFVNGTIRAKSAFGFVVLHFNPNIFSTKFIDNEELGL